MCGDSLRQPLALAVTVQLTDTTATAVWWPGSALPMGRTSSIMTEPPPPTGADIDVHKTQRVGLAVAKSPFGPWTRFDEVGL
jgi:hypothetical protein